MICFGVVLYFIFDFLLKPEGRLYIPAFLFNSSNLSLVLSSAGAVAFRPASHSNLHTSVTFNVFLL